MSLKRLEVIRLDGQSVLVRPDDEAEVRIRVVSSKFANGVGNPIRSAKDLVAAIESNACSLRYEEKT